MTETCPYCRADTYPHCYRVACTWVRCIKDREHDGCGKVIDDARHIVLDTTTQTRVPWPHSLPDDN